MEKTNYAKYKMLDVIHKHSVYRSLVYHKQSINSLLGRRNVKFLYQKFETSN